MAPTIVDRLLASGEPSIRWKIRAHVLGDDPQARSARRLCDEIRRWPAEARYYRVKSERVTALDHVDWGGVDSGRMNEWVTADALTVLAAAGRL